LVFVFLSFICASSFAVVNIGISGGYASVAMTEVNKTLEDLSNNMQLIGLSPSLTKLGHGLYANLDLNFGVIPFLNFGLRTGILYCLQGKISLTGNLSVLNPALGTGTISRTYDSLLIPVMGGLGLSVGLPGMPFSINASAYAGYGFSIVSEGGKISSGSINIPFNPIYNGGGFVMDAGIGFGFSLLPFISATLNIAYKLAKIPEVKATSDVGLGAPLNVIIIHKDEVLKGSNGKALPIDYSGINIGLGINIGF
ncbi:MAG: hypothetical protein N3E50_08595, partial [Candidatus Goldbacteria bacterium]|nr:hypothetical protein [Candidatus Goldiibacteriota bacterium]